MNALTEHWIDIGPLAAIPRQGARVVKGPRGCIAVFRTMDDHVFALNDSCPHKGGPLSEGIVHGHGVTCPLHAWVFDLNTGAALGADVGQVARYDVKVEAGMVYLSVAP